MHKKPTLKVKFIDFWTEDFDEKFIWTKVLSKNYQLDFTGKPDVIIFGSYGCTNQFLYRKIPRIFYRTEIQADYNKNDCDFKFSMYDAKNSQNNYYISNVIKTPAIHSLVNDSYSADILKLRNKTKTKFCNFLYMGNAFESHIRERFAVDLMKYKKIDCPGKRLNNMPSFDNRNTDGWFVRKNNFIAEYKFTIAFENCSKEGYISEKIFTPFLVKSIPIYWGDPDISNKFNTKAFINCHDFDNFDDVIKRIIEIDNDDALYQEYLNASPFLTHNKLPQFIDVALFEDKVFEIVKKLTNKNFVLIKRDIKYQAIFTHIINTYIIKKIVNNKAIRYFVKLSLSMLPKKISAVLTALFRPSS